jgi:hypothetical protein
MCDSRNGGTTAAMLRAGHIPQRDAAGHDFDLPEVTFSQRTLESHTTRA